MGEQGQLGDFSVEVITAFTRAPTLVLTISTCFFNIMIPPKSRATFKLGRMGWESYIKPAPRQGPCPQETDDRSCCTAGGRREAAGCTPLPPATQAPLQSRAVDLGEHVPKAAAFSVILEVYISMADVMT